MKTERIYCERHGICEHETSWVKGEKKYTCLKCKRGEPGVIEQIKGKETKG